jgi:hypothetical protein
MTDHDYRILAAAIVSLLEYYQRQAEYREQRKYRRIRRAAA